MCFAQARKDVKVKGNKDPLTCCFFPFLFFKPVQLLVVAGERAISVDNVTLPEEVLRKGCGRVGGSRDVSVWLQHYPAAKLSPLWSRSRHVGPGAAFTPQPRPWAGHRGL